MDKSLRSALNLLNQNGIKYFIMTPLEALKLERDFINAFIIPQKKERLLMNASKGPKRKKDLDYYKFFNSSRNWDLLDDLQISAFEWVSFNGKSLCYLLWSSPSLNVIDLSVTHLQDIELSFFSDAYFFDHNFSRTIVNTRDNDIFLAEGGKW